MNQPIFVLGGPIEIASFAFSAITALCSFLISIIALRHTAKPKIEILLLSEGKYFCDRKVTLRFKAVNKGHWYAHPMVIDLQIYCNFAKRFTLYALNFGSRQEKQDKEVKLGVEGMQYFKAEKIILGREKSGEDFSIELKLPKNAGKHLIKFDAFSKNGVSYKKNIELECIK